MGMTHGDFYRTFPAVAADQPWQARDNKVKLELPGGWVSIQLGPEEVRKIGLLVLPITRLDFEFTNQTQEQIETFMARFDLSFRRGGG
jgi:hypothetical protein